MFRRRQFLQGTDEEGSGLPDVWWFRTDGHRMTKSDWDDRRADASACSSTARRSPRPDEHGERIVDDSFLLLFNAHHEDVDVHAADPRASASTGRSSCAPTDPDAEPSSLEVAALEELMVAARSLVLLRAAHDRASAPPTGCSSAATSASPRRASSCRTCATSASRHLYLPPSFQARPGSTHGYDVVDPTSISEELGGEAEFRALVAAAREAGLGVILDIVPNHMAIDDANRYWADRSCASSSSTSTRRPAATAASSTSTTSPGVRQEDPEVFEETHRLALALVRDGLVDGLRIDHPDGLADPAGYLERLRDGGVEHVWVEKILDPGEQLRDSGRSRARSATSSSTTWRRCSSTPPARRR